MPISLESSEVQYVRLSFCKSLIKYFAHLSDCRSEVYRINSDQQSSRSQKYVIGRVYLPKPKPSKFIWTKESVLKVMYTVFFKLIVVSFLLIISWPDSVLTRKNKVHLYSKSSHLDNFESPSDYFFPSSEARYDYL